jgi:large subunit ribosomal protein L29
MAIMRIKEIVNLSSEDREKKLVDLRVELARLRTMVQAGGAVENPTRIRELRKTIAQILTIERESKLGIRKTAEQSGKKTSRKAKIKTKNEKEKTQ